MLKKTKISFKKDELWGKIKVKDTNGLRIKLRIEWKVCYACGKE